MTSLGVQGLTSQEAAKRFAQVGPNALEARRVGFYARYAKYVIGIIPLMLLAAAALSFFSGKMGDGLIILALFFINIGIQVWHERKADAATKKLQAHLTTSVKTHRDGVWKGIPSRELVKGDVVELSVGDVVPADVRFLEARNLTLNESTVTGESLPKQKQEGESAYSGSFVTTGRAYAEVSATGARTYFGKALLSASRIVKRSALERDILTIARYLSVSSIVAIALITIVLYSVKAPLIDIATLDLSLLIAGIPVALPTVMSLIISVGIVGLARKHAVVRRLSALEDFANVTMLLSDKTGTLTENSLHVGPIVTFGSFGEDEVLRYALACAEDDGKNPIDLAIVSRAKEADVSIPEPKDFIPGDSERKRSTAFIEEDGRVRVASLGAAQVVRALCDMPEAEVKRFDAALSASAARGERVLALALGEGREEHMQMLGLIPLSDRLRSDVPAVLHFLGQNGVRVKMLTGDSYEIAADVAHTLGFKGEILKRAVFDDRARFEQTFETAAGYAEMLPNDKVLAVEEAKKHYTVAVTGDGVNDVPAVKAADVGIAVKNAVDALRETADIVLLDNGLSVIRDAIVEARKVFVRLYHYSVFRISESFRIIVTIAVIGLIFKVYPLTPVQLILLALMNDIPVVSIAFDRVRISRAPSSIDVRGRFVLSSLLGLTGVGNSLLMFWLTTSLLHLPWDMIQTVFFLKLVVSGHLLLYVAHTDEVWWRYLPSKQVIASLTATQVFATVLAVAGIFVAPISWKLAVFVWLWSFLWMQVSELAKDAVLRKKHAPTAVTA
jgi:H+-transporting ATPase